MPNTSQRFSIGRTDELVFVCSRPLSEFYILSPCVWKEEDSYHVLVRAVNHSDNPAEKVARIYYGSGASGTKFVMDREPVIPPGSEEDDRDGCEDPTLASGGGSYYVYYSGWNQQKKVGQLLLASGPSIHGLKKRGRVFADPDRFRNAKEATVVQASDGTWRLFFEYAEDDRSRIGLASAQGLEGPWSFQKPLFEARPERWDSWHLSTGPVSMADPHAPVMFYNGATRDTRWRIGWIEFDENFTRVTARCDDPVIEPPPRKREPEDTDIAFAASAVEGATPGDIELYYSIADRWVMRTMLRAGRG